MELRDLRAFTAAARELHFARAAASLHMSPSTMSELIQRLELELGAPLFTRTTRSIRLTDAGAELQGRAEVILDLTVQASAAVAAIARGGASIVRLGATPPAAAVLGPHLAAGFGAAVPGLSAEVVRMWLPALLQALRAGAVDAALTCGELAPQDPGITSAEIGSEQLLVGLRPGNPLERERTVALSQLRDQRLGMHPAHLFPAWAAVERGILTDARITPPIAELNDTDLTSRSWDRQLEIDWIMLTGSLLSGHEHSVVRPVPGHFVPFTLSWPAGTPRRAAVERFIGQSLAAELPCGWQRPASAGAEDRSGPAAGVPAGSWRR